MICLFLIIVICSLGMCCFSMIWWIRWWVWLLVWFWLVEMVVKGRVLMSMSMIWSVGWNMWNFSGCCGLDVDVVLKV